MISTILGLKFSRRISSEENVRFSVLAVSLILLSILACFSVFTYSVIIFQENWIAIIISIVVGAIVFNIYRMLVVTSLESDHSELSRIYNDPKSLILDYEQRLKKVPNTELGIESLVKDIMYETRAKILSNPNRAAKDRITFFIKLSITLFFGVCFSTGLEIFIFKDQLNDLINQVNLIYANQVNSWIFSSTAPNSTNGIINSNSLLLVINLLIDSLGSLKYLVDFIVVFIFCVPLLLVYRTTLISKGKVVEEMALDEIEITINHTLKSLAYCDDFLVRKFKNETLGRFER
jgi:hypothetical protein